MSLDLIIIRKRFGIDCDEAESAEVKQVIKEQLTNGAVPTYWAELFPIETAEAYIEHEHGTLYP